MPLKIAAKIYPEERSYFDEVLQPLIRAAGSQVEFVGEVDQGGRQQLLGGAVAFVFPIEWREPFGLVMIESLACGTPVVAWRRGSVPEVLEDGVTGYVVDDLDAAVEAVGRIGRLSRARCRQAFEERFDAARMARDYVEVYRGLAAGSAPALR
jgi:glycosyltransferase involved in cell wall biosynthesis